MEQGRIVRAVDTGRRNTKFTTGVDAAGMPTCDMIPSLAIPGEGRVATDALSGQRRKSVEIQVGDLFYTVGPDAGLAADVYNPSVLQHDRACETSEYMALTLGAIHYMQVPHIDLLVVGLPVATMRQTAVVNALERKLSGTHELSTKRKVQVDKVRALAQPIGALMYTGVREGRVKQLNRQRNLVIDPGERTFDWVVSDGMQMLDRRSFSLPRGMFDVLQSIAQGVSVANNTDYRDYLAIDEALRARGKPAVQLFGKPYALDKHMALARKLAEQAVAEMLHYVGDGADIDTIIVVGGASFFFKAAIRAAFPRHTVLFDDAPLFANVKGFHLAGLAQMSRARPATAPTAIQSQEIVPAAPALPAPAAASPDATETAK